MSSSDSEEKSSAKGDAMERSLTGKEVMALLGAAMFKSIAAPAAREALLFAVKEAGLPELAPAVALAEAAACNSSQPSKKGKGKAAKSEGNADGKKRKARSLSDMNVYMAYFYDCIAQDPNNPAFKLPTTTDGEGKTVGQRGGSMTLVSQCWKAMTEADKTRFLEILEPFLTQINAQIASEEGRPAGHLGEQVKEFVSKNKLEKEMQKLVYRSIEAGTGINPARFAGTAPPATTTTPSKAGGSKAAAANGATAEKANGDKRPRKEDKDASASKKSKVDPKADAEKQSQSSKPDEASGKKQKKQQKQKEAEAKAEADKAAAAKKKKEEEEAAAKKKAAESEEESSSDDSDDDSDE